VKEGELIMYRVLALIMIGLVCLSNVFSINVFGTAAKLSETEQIDLLNSLNMQLPWKVGTSQCTTGYLHGFYDQGISNFEPIGESLDYGSCQTWNWGDINDKFDVYTMLDGTVTFQPSGQCRLDVTKTVNYKGVERKITIVYLHLDLPNGYKPVQFTQNQKIASIALDHNKAVCGGGGNYISNAPHLHITLLIDGVKVYFSKKQAGYAKGWHVGGWTNVIKAPIGSAYQGGIFCYVPVGTEANCDNNPSAVGKDQFQQIINKSTTPQPTLQSPVSGTSTTNGIWPTLQWSTGSAPYGYRIQVSKNDAFSSTEVDQCSTNTNYLPTGTGAEAFMRDRRGTLHWRVAYVKSAWNNNQTTCKSGGINGDWSEKWIFNNQITPLSLQSPASGTSTTNGIWPTLQWSTGSAPYGYRIQVSKNSTFSSTEVDQCSTNTSYLPTGTGAEAFMRDRRGTLHWRVAYVKSTWNQNTCKSVGIIGDWSQAWTFNNQITPLALQSPASGTSTTNGIWPTLQWSTGSAPYGYRIQVSKNSFFIGNEVDECSTNTSYLPTGTGADAFMRDRRGTLYWRVAYVKTTWNQATCKLVGISGDWSPAWTFNNQITPLVLQSPASGTTTTNGIWPTLQWSTGNAPYGYRIQVSKNSSFSITEVDECRNNTNYFPTGTGADAFMRDRRGTLYWRVAYVKSTWNQTTCKSVGISGDWSPAWTFNNQLIVVNTPTLTKSPTPIRYTPTVSSPTASPRPTDAELTAPVLRSPADNSVDVSTKVELDWDDVTKGNVNRYEVEVCIETVRNSGDWNCDKYDTDGPESRWKVWDRTDKIFPQRKIRWRVNANDGTKDGPVSEWRYFQPRYTYPTNPSANGDTLKISISRESNDITYQCKYNFTAFGSNGSWSSIDKTSFSGSSCSFSISSMRSKGANSGRTIYMIVTSDSNKTLGDFSGRENTDGRSWYFSMP